MENFMEVPHLRGLPLIALSPRGKAIEFVIVILECPLMVLGLFKSPWHLVSTPGKHIK
jgi:hypothetical protein